MLARVGETLVDFKTTRSTSESAPAMTNETLPVIDADPAVLARCRPAVIRRYLAVAARPFFRADAKVVSHQVQTGAFILARVAIAFIDLTVTQCAAEAGSTITLVSVR